MAINLNINLKTINGESITGTGNLQVNSINWRGELAGAPDIPKDYDAYHNLTDKNTYLYFDGRWQIFSAKGEDGATDLGGMIFPHDTLEEEDVGKLVILKDKKAQLPIFEPAAPAQPGIVEFAHNTDSYSGARYKSEEVQLTALPQNEEYFLLRTGVGHYNFSFRTVATLDNDIEIGVSVEATIDNIISTILNHPATSPALAVTKVSADTFKVEWKWLYIGGPNEELYFSPILPTCDIVPLPNANKTDNGTTKANHLGAVLDAYYLLRGMQKGGMDVYQQSSWDLLKHILSNANFTEDVNLIDANGTYALKMPASDEELKLGIKDLLENGDDIVAASWIVNRLTIEHSFDEEEVGFVAPTGADLYLGNWSDMTVVSDIQYPSAAYCKYPILGMVKSVGDESVVIYTEPVLDFISMHNGTAEWEGLFDFNRIFVLHPDYPGLLLALEEAIASFGDVLDLTSCGYVAALDKSIESGVSFKGSLMSDTVSLLILSLLIFKEEI